MVLTASEREDPIERQGTYLSWACQLYLHGLTSSFLTAAHLECVLVKWDCICFLHPSSSANEDTAAVNTRLLPTSDAAQASRGPGVSKPSPRKKTNSPYLRIKPLCFITTRDPYLSRFLLWFHSRIVDTPGAKGNWGTVSGTCIQELTSVNRVFKKSP